MTKIAIPIRPKSFKLGEKLMQKAIEAGSDMIEIWCDRIHLPELSKLIDQKPKEIGLILNLKDNLEQGEYTGDLEDRMTILEGFPQADYIDLPYRESETIMPKDTSKVILSFHDFQKTPTLSELQDILHKMAEFNPAIIKIATTAHTEKDVIHLFQLQVNNPDLMGRMIIIGMGQKGQATRTTARMFKQPITFASLDAGNETAPGQLSAKDLKEKLAKLSLQK
jgi:3-dehydroquinate dehydratase type I